MLFVRALFTSARLGYCGQLLGSFGISRDVSVRGGGVYISHVLGGFVFVLLMNHSPSFGRCRTVTLRSITLESVIFPCSVVSR